mgnify:CR=1 FL=1
MMKELRKRAVEIGPDWSDCSLLNSAADEIERLRSIEAAAVAAVNSEQWQGDAFHERMCELSDVLHGDPSADEPANVEGERDGAALCDRSRSTDGLCGNVATERRPTGADFDEEAK